MKKYLGLGAVLCGLMLIAAPAMALTLQDLITNGFTIQDKTFTNFSYTGTDPASAITAINVFSPGTIDVHGWIFLDTLNGGRFTSNFTIGYTISVLPSATQVFIMGSKDQINTGLIPNGITMMDVQSVGTLNTSGVSTANETTQINYVGVKSINTLSTATIPAGGLITYQQDFFETTTTVPEASLLWLLGFGLVSVPAFARLFKK